MVTLLIIGLFAVVLGFIYYRNKTQKQHSVLRQYPLLGMFRYFFEMLGPEMRQYITDSNTEGKPFSRYIYTQVVKLGKYMDNITGFGSQRDFEKSGFDIANAMICTPEKNLEADNSTPFDTFVYKVAKETLFSRHDTRHKVSVKPWLLKEAIQIGANDQLITHPWQTKSFVGMSAMSYGSLGDHAVETLARGLALAGSWVNTGEGGLAPLHLVGGGDVVYQFGPAMFGCRDKEGNFSPERYKQQVSHKQVVATEVKFHQGAKVKGGILPKEKINAKISEIRGIPMGQDCLSPNAYPHISSAEDVGMFIRELKQLSGKPVGIKFVVGQVSEIVEVFKKLNEMNALPNFVTIDGGEGGSGAAPQDMADSLGIPVFQSIVLINRIFNELKIRDRITVFASGKLVTPDQVAIAMALGADCINIARGLMMQLGCIQALKCHTNHCPVGVATQDPKLQDGLVITEKMYRVANYMTTLRKNTFLIGAACGVKTPRQFTRKHLVYQDASGCLMTGEQWSQCQLAS